MPKPTLSIALSQTSLGLAIFEEHRLNFLEAYSLETLPKAHDAAAGYVLRCVDSFNPALVVMQRSPDTLPDIRAAIFEALRAANRPVSEISEEEVIASFGEPPLNDKTELRQLMRVLFPQIPSGGLVFTSLDAVATGLCFQTKLLLNS